MGQLGQAAEFLGLGAAYTDVRGLSPDGTAVVGSLYDSAAKTTALPFLWTKSTGIQSLKTDGVARGSASGASGDGSIIVGNVAQDVALNEGVRWVDGGAPFGLGDLPGGVVNSEATDISYDGSVIVGKSVAAQGVIAFRRTEAGGLESLGALTTGSQRSEALAISGDGLMIVGSSSSTRQNSGIYGEAFIWTEAGGMQGLGHLNPNAAGILGSLAYDVSEHGDVVVGMSSVLQGAGLVSSEAFRWTESSGMVSLGDLPGDGIFSAAYGVSGDGSIIVGSGRTGAGERAFIWDDVNQMRDLQNVLSTDYGLGSALTGWILQSATAISADGKVLAGIGRNPNGESEGWYVDLNVTLIPGDANSDGKVDLTDFGILKSNFGTGTTLAQGDFSGDGKVDLSDFGILKSNFGQSSAASAAVPEPSGLVLAALALVGGLVTWRRRRTA